MKTLALLGTAAILAASPASIGLIGNASFSEDVPVRPPATATLLDGQGNAMPPASPDRTDDRGRDGHGGRLEAEPGDDHGGARPRSTPTEVADDRDDGGDRSGRDGGGGSGSGESGDDGGDRHGGSGGGDDGGRHGEDGDD